MALAKGKTRDNITWTKELSEHYHELAKAERCTLSEYILSRLQAADEGRGQRDELIDGRIGQLTAEVKQLRADLHMLIESLDRFMQQLEPKAERKEAPVPVATYEQMYGPVEPADAPAALPMTPVLEPEPEAPSPRRRFKLW